LFKQTTSRSYTQDCAAVEKLLLALHSSPSPSPDSNNGGGNTPGGGETGPGVPDDEYESAGERPPSTYNRDDPTKDVWFFIPKNLAEYNEFNRLNGGNPPQLDKTDIRAILDDTQTSFEATSVARYNYILHIPVFREVLIDWGEDEAMVNALISFALAGGFIGDEQAMTINLDLLREKKNMEAQESSSTSTTSGFTFYMRAGVDHEFEGHTFYCTAQTETWWSPLIWLPDEGYFAGCNGDGDIGVCMSIGRDASGNISGHGWFIGTDSLTTRVFNEFTVTSSTFYDFKPVDMSIYDGVWSGLTADNRTWEIEIRGGYFIRYEVDGEPRPAELGRMIINRDGNLYIEVADGSMRSHGKIVIDGDSMTIGSGWRFTRVGE
jgi:hypothetical protein